MMAFGLLLGFLLALGACGSPQDDDTRPRVVATTMMLEDVLNNIGGELVRVEGSMGPGVDPHVYRATPGDFASMERAELIVYNGHFLEARLGEVLSEIPTRTYAAAEALPEDRLIQAFEYGGNYDPHVWFDASLWIEVSKGVEQRLIELMPEQQAQIEENAAAYIAGLEELHTWAQQQIGSIPAERRLLITAHDAFRYFGQAYDMEVKGLQGLSTQSDYGVREVSEMVELIIERDIPAIFLESSVAPRSVQSLIRGVEERGGQVRLGGELFSDAMGARDTPEGTYEGMFRHNVHTIVEALQ
ncbi:MAG: metal ABC transporter solute-binding protein, Zn/Mn family [Cyclonatronaceae bacterium]